MGFGAPGISPGRARRARWPFALARACEPGGATVVGSEPAVTMAADSGRSEPGATEPFIVFNLLHFIPVFTSTGRALAACCACGARAGAPRHAPCQIRPAMAPGGRA